MNILFSTCLKYYLALFGLVTTQFSLSLDGLPALFSTFWRYSVEALESGSHASSLFRSVFFFISTIGIRGKAIMFQGSHWTPGRSRERYHRGEATTPSSSSGKGGLRPGTPIRPTDDPPKDIYIKTSA